MAIQYSLFGGVRITSAEDAPEVLALLGGQYRELASAIDAGESDTAVYWRIQFALLSVHSPIEATFEAYRQVRLWHARFKRLPSRQRLQTLLLGAKGSNGQVTQYCWQKSGYMLEFDKAWKSDRTCFTRNGETDSDWRFRLVRNVKGLGIAKASFAVALANPSTSSVCCVDTHMWQLWHGQPPRSSIGKRAYLEVETAIRDLGASAGLGAFVAQWALWDAKRGFGANAHACLTLA